MGLKIKGKILAGFSIVILLLLGVCAYLVLNMKNIDDSYTAMINNESAAFISIQGALAQYSKAATYLNDYIITGDSVDIDQFQQALGEGDASLNQIAPTIDSEKEKQLYDELKKQVSVFKGYGKQMTTLVQNREMVQNEKDRIAAEESVMVCKKANTNVINNLTTSAEELAVLQNQLLADSKKQTMAAGANAVSVSIIIIAVTIILGLVIAIVIARIIANPIRLVDDQAVKIAAGDLAGEMINIRSRDEAGRLADSFNRMRENLIEIVKQLQEKSQNVASSATELSAGAENVLAGATETASAMTEVAATVEQITGNTQHISEASNESASLAKEGREGLQEVAVQMEMIQEAAVTAGDVVSGLSSATGKITQIVELITQIADQTNLLALNAAIEAARAGEQGRGFAVVAEEVRQLAEQSADAAKEIQALVVNVQQESQKAVQGTKENAARVEAGASKIQNVKALFEQIIDSVQNLAEEIQQVAAATEQMSASVQNVAATTEEQTAVMDEVSSTTQNLSVLAEELEALSMKFKLA